MKQKPKELDKDPEKYPMYIYKDGYLVKLKSTITEEELLKGRKDWFDSLLHQPNKPKELDFVLRGNK